MIEYGQVIEEIRVVLGPLKYRVVREEWHNSNQQPTAVVPRFRHFTFMGEPGVRVLYPLDPVVGRVEVDRGQW